MSLSVDRLRELLDYDRDTGIFRWTKPTARRVKVGDEAGTVWKGYRYISIDSKPYLAHRLAWFYVHGEWPLVIDHINRNRSDNRISNLRDTTAQGNAQNKTPALGRFASWDSEYGKWRSTIRIKGKKRHLGYFDTADEAHAAYARSKAEQVTGRSTSPEA